jgi:hypothetical protein
MANKYFLLRLLPCLLLAACGNPASEGHPPASSDSAAPASPASAPPAGKKDDRAATAEVPTATAPASAAIPAKPGLPVDASQLPPVASVPSIVCTKQQEGWSPECMAGEYQIAVYMEGCGADGFYGEVHSDAGPAVTLRTGFAEFPAQPVAKLPQNQFVCVAADARKRIGERLWYYVVAIPVETVKACKGKELCGDPGQPQVEWVQSAPRGKCRFENGRYADCAAGWVSANEFAEYSNGL